MRYNRLVAAFGTNVGLNGVFFRDERIKSRSLESVAVPNYADIKIALHSPQWSIFFNGGLSADAAVIQKGDDRTLASVRSPEYANSKSPSMYRLMQTNAQPE